MTTIGSMSLGAVLAGADARQPDAAPAQGADAAPAAFASLLAALVAPAPGTAPTPAAPEAEGLSELEGAQDDAATEAADLGRGTSDVGRGAIAGVQARASDDEEESDDEGASDERDGASSPVASLTSESAVAASHAMAASIAASLEPVKVPGALDPEFREKLGRVVSRMRELGHEVRVVETVRSQARQDRLFAQGRSAPGPVVTWTRRSRHTEGLAADVTVDGRYDGEGYATLQRVAREEGLHTLGARDPGHLELPRAGGRALESLQAMGDAGARVERAASEVRAPAAVAAARLPQPVESAPVARVAEVAGVARVAQVAQVAEVARPASPSRPGGVAQAVQAAAVDPRGLVRAAMRRAPQEEAGGEDAWRDESGARLDALATALGAGTHGARGASFGESLAEVQGLVRPGDLSRVERVLAAQDAARGRPLHELSLALDAADGGVDRIRVGVTGRSVGATIETSDAASAARLGARMDELTRALEHAGLEPEALRVRAIESRDAVREVAAREAARAATVQVAESNRGAGAENDPRHQQSRERDVWANHDRRQQQGGGRHRSRREQQETTE